jgi:hypothetical protein
MYTPDSLYKAAPFLYILIGLGVIFTLDGFMAVFSGALLTGAGIMVLMMRRRNQAALAAAAAARKKSRRR